MEEISLLEEVKIASPFELEIKVHKPGADKYILNCHGKVSQVLMCSKALKEFEHPCDLNFEVVVDLDAKVPTWELNGDYDEVYEIRVNPCSPDFDISEIIRQEIILQEPMVPISDESLSVDWIEHEEEKPEVDPRWEALKKLKKDS